MDENTALIPMDEVNLDLAYSDKKSIDAVLQKLKAAAEAHIPDTETEEGRKAIASNSYKVSRCKTWMAKHGRSMTEDWRKKTKTVTALINHVESFCDELRDSTRRPLTEIEEAEAAERERRRFQMEFAEDHTAALEINDLMDRERIIAAKEAEFAAAEAARLQKENKAKMVAEAVEFARKEAQDAIEKAERDRLQAIEDAKQAAEAAERDRQAAILSAEAAKQAAIEAERRKGQEEADRKERERLAAEEEKKRIAAVVLYEEQARKDRLAQHKSHRNAVRNAAIKAIITVGSFDDEEAERIFEIIDAGKVPGISVNY